MSTFQLKILKNLILFFTIQASSLLAQKSDIIIEDNWDQTTDKLAHSTTSFGLYYTLRYFEFSKFEAFTAAAIIGFSYEVYQINDPRETDSDFRGISIQDMGYNVLGIDLSKNSIESAKKAAIGELHSEASTLAVAIATKILKREISLDDQQQLLDESLEELSGTNS